MAAARSCRRLPLLPPTHFDPRSTGLETRLRLRDQGDALKTVTMPRWTLFALLLLFSTACALVAPSPAPPVEPVVATHVPRATTALATPMPRSATPTSLATSTVNPCPEPSHIEPPARDLSLDAYIVALREFLRQGGDPALVSLQEQEELHLGDLTGDGVEEAVFLLIDPDAQQFPPKGHLAIYTCESGEVTLLYHYKPGDWYGLELIGIADLTEDGVAELSFSEISCGANTCWHTPRVWSWQGRDFEARMEDEFLFPFPWYTLQNGALVVVSHGMGSVGAGPQRTITTTLAWTGTAITITDEIFAPATYRYHAFLDGDRALAGGDFGTAEALYRRVAEDPSLELWGAFASTEEEQTWLVALGRWRLMLLQAYLGNSTEAEATYATLRDENAPGTTAYALVGLGERFWRGYQRNDDLGNACSYVMGGVEVPAVLDFLATFGYANPIYEAVHLCPFTASGVSELPF